ncbi:DUF305 domain-containing protein [Cnuibacter sp. UC19_7]|uniref:DUF305 domain-containing protein n=1 Tax=Cnuibacter sp. UC19_7 TaxID=3350166 RepID=UPI0036725F33
MTSPVREPEATEEGEEREGAAPARSRSTGRGRGLAAALTTAIAVGLVCFLAGWFLAPRSSSPGEGSAEAGFARDMQTHHDQAVQMAMLIRDRTDDEAVRSLAYDIATSQAQQSGQMFAWLNEWNLPQASTQPPMTWMLQPVITPGADDMAGHGMAAGSGTVPTTMPGFASDADIARLTAAQGTDAERIFLQLMIAHHQGGVEMADAVIARTADPVVLALANSIVFAQTGEIQYMQQLLDARGGPLPA